jgi:hypothetical protein
MKATHSWATERQNLERQPAKSQSQNLASETKLKEINLSR